MRSTYSARMRFVLGFLLFGVVAFAFALPAPGGETGGQAAVAGADEAPAGGEVQGWRDREAVARDLTEDLAGGFSFWWVLVAFFAASGLLFWLMWQNRHGMMLGKGGSEQIDIVARRMFGPKHGVVCVRLREREFLLGIGGDTITLLSEWRNVPRREDARKENGDEHGRIPDPLPGGRGD